MVTRYHLGGIDKPLSLSHELLTPITAIKGYNDMLKMTASGNLDKRQLEIVEIISQNTNDLLNIIQKMLNMTQIDGGPLGLDRIFFSAVCRI